jgi:biopolymer transport protein ExbD
VVSIVDNAGQIAYAVDEQPTTLAALNDKVIERARANNQALSANDIFAQAQIFIRADQDLAYSAVIDAMAQLKNGGFAKVGIYAEEAEST